MVGVIVSEGLEVNPGLLELPPFSSRWFLAFNKVNERRFPAGFKAESDLELSSQSNS